MTIRNSDEWLRLQTLCRSKLNLQLSDLQSSQLEQYLLHLQQYNEHTNLVANAAPDLVLRNHVFDSMSIIPYVAEKMHATSPASDRSFSVVDIGSGAGFPALILAIIIAGLRVVCIESIGKKTKFLEWVIGELKLHERVSVINGRAEEVAGQKGNRESFDFATARAVGKLDLVCELAVPFLRVGGCLLAQKSREQVEVELPQAHKALAMLGGIVNRVEPVDRELIDKDFVVVEVLKETPTPARFPRPTAQLKRPV